MATSYLLQVGKLSAEQEAHWAELQGLGAGQARSCWRVECRELTSLRLEVDMQVRKGREADVHMGLWCPTLFVPRPAWP